MLKLFSLALRPLISLTRAPRVRYSNFFYELEGLLHYYPREEMLKLALRYVLLSKIEGDYLEFGVFKGETLAAAYHLARRNNLSAMRFFGFDSFQGLPKLEGIDREGGYQFQHGDYKCDLEDVRSGLLERGVDLTRTKLIPGWFSESLTSETCEAHDLRKAAIIWVDCDLYESTKPVLDFITPLVQDGTVLVFDDWFCFRGRRDMGEQRAFREWLNRTPHISAQEYQRVGWHGNSFLLSVTPY